MWNQGKLGIQESWPEAKTTSKINTPEFRRVPRIATSGVVVEVRSIGSSVSYKFQCVDISMGGLKVALHEKGLPPFARGSIVELVVSFSGDWDGVWEEALKGAGSFGALVLSSDGHNSSTSPTIKILGKVAWRAVRSSLKEVGIKIIEEEDRDLWERLFLSVKSSQNAASLA